MNLHVEIFLKLVIAIVFGGLIGLERERHDQPAGLKTHIVLCVGATLITIVSISLARDIGDPQRTDPARIAAQIVSGIGFLGGGAIIRMGATVRGLTTAACLWAVSGVGMALGAGYYFAATLAVLAMLFTLNLLGYVQDAYIHKKSFKRLSLTARSSPDILGSVEKVLSDNLISIRNIHVEREMTGPEVEISALVTVPDQLNVNKLSEEIFQIPGTIRFDLE